MAAEELRTLAFACRPYQEGEPENMAETNLIFLGITGMRDPIRPEAIRAVADFQKAGVSTVMITGDHNLKFVLECETTTIVAVGIVRIVVVAIAR